MSAKIRIDVHRTRDRQVTRLEGDSGIAVCMQNPVADPVQMSDPPVVAFRCDNAAQLAWNLAAMMAGVRHLNPDAFAQALELMELCDFNRPQLTNRLPKEPPK